MTRPGEDDAVIEAAKALSLSFGSATRVMYAERAVAAAYPVIADAMLREAEKLAESKVKAAGHCSGCDMSALIAADIRSLRSGGLA